MKRFHATDKGNIPFTAEEELERDREEANYKAVKVSEALKPKKLSLEERLEKVEAALAK